MPPSPFLFPFPHCPPFPPPLTPRPPLSFSSWPGRLGSRAASDRGGAARLVALEHLLQAVQPAQGGAAAAGPRAAHTPPRVVAPRTAAAAAVPRPEGRQGDSRAARDLRRSARGCRRAPVQDRTPAPQRVRGRRRRRRGRSARGLAHIVAVERRREHLSACPRLPSGADPLPPCACIGGMLAMPVLHIFILLPSPVASVSVVRGRCAPSLCRIHAVLQMYAS